MSSSAGGPGPIEPMQVRSSYIGSEGMSEGTVQGRLKPYVESKTQNGDVTRAGRVGTMKLGESGDPLEHKVCTKTHLLCAILPHSGMSMIIPENSKMSKTFSSEVHIPNEVK